jgi:hypothetical protein
LADRENIKREEIIDSNRMQEICEELCKEGLIEPGVPPLLVPLGMRDFPPFLLVE